ncbi:MAG: DNA cytosine methyltransferase [Saprospiraceae bacterium]|nr:DNA cytosine methyltransferase [Saprospiraceae bacterium]
MLDICTVFENSMSNLKSEKGVSKIIYAVDLFCGIGALTCGLQKAGIQVVAGYDIDKSCRHGYEHNNSVKFYGRSVSDLSGDEISALYPADSLKILVGCAPCQPFSTHTNKSREKQEEDERWNLLDAFGRLVEETCPDFVSMENVTNLRNQGVFRTFVATLERLGYFVNYQIVDCPDYGIPQKRRRLILLASKLAKPCLIEPTHIPHRTTYDEIGNLPKIKAGEVCTSDPLHRAPTMNDTMLARIKQSVPNGTWLDWEEELRTPCHRTESGQSYKSVYGRMSWDKPSPTITTQFYNFGTGRFGHPEQDRAISLREGALLQTFPCDYQFVAPDEPIHFTKIGRYIGNAVPVRLGEVIGLSIIEHFKRHL